MDGFWTPLGSPALVDWCEPNYVVTFYVAEFWNTLTSLFIAALGFWGALASRRLGLEARFHRAYLGLAVVGLGSAAFHGTLLRIPQALDELPMVYLGLLCCWALLYRDRVAAEGRNAGIAMLVYAVAFTGAYAWSTSAFHLFLASYAFTVAYVSLRSMHLTWVKPAPRLMSRLLLGAALGYLGTLSCCWVPEHVLLSCDHPAQALPLHGIWHIGAGLGTYWWILWAIADRRRATGSEPTLERSLLPIWGDRQSG